MKVTSSNHFFCSNLKSALVLFCLITTAAYAKDPSWVRATSSGGSGADFPFAIKVGPDHNQYVTGNFSSTAKFAHTTLVSAGGTDIFLAKYGRSGELVWIVGAGGPDADSGQDLAFDRAGNVYLTGSFHKQRDVRLNPRCHHHGDRYRDNHLPREVHSFRRPRLGANRHCTVRPAKQPH